MKMKYKVEVNRGPYATFEAVGGEQEGYNIFSSLAKAKKFALNNMPPKHPADVSYWRESVRNTTREEILEGLAN